MMRQKGINFGGREHKRGPIGKRAPIAPKKIFAQVYGERGTMVLYFPPSVEGLLPGGNPQSTKIRGRLLELMAIGLRALDARELKTLGEWVKGCEQAGNWNSDIPSEILGKVTAAIEKGYAWDDLPIHRIAKQALLKVDGKTLGRLIGMNVSILY